MIDEETGFYYYGARYYNPRTQLWQSPDPVLDSYLDGEPNNGVFRSSNLALYTYTQNNPVTYRDPNGLWDHVGHQHTPHAAALAVGFPPAAAREIGRAGWAPDLDDRRATSASSIANSGDPNGHFQATHLLTGTPAGPVQARARERFEEVIMNMPLNERNFRFRAEQENILHAFGDSFAHVNLSSTGEGCPCMYGPPYGHAPHTYPDDPTANPGQYRQYLGALYDALGRRPGLTPRMTRDEFITTMMREVAGVTQFFGRAAAQQRNADRVIQRLEAMNPAGNQ